MVREATRAVQSQAGALNRVKRSARLALGWLAFLTPFANGLAHAQDVPTVISPLEVDADSNGVNIATGKTVVQGPVLSVPAAPRLRFDRVQNAAPYFVGKISRNFEVDDSHLGNYSLHTIEGTSESFRCTEPKVCDSVIGTGSTFSGQGGAYLRAGSGEKYSYNLIHVYAVSNTQITVQKYASRIAYPDGEILTFTYGTATLPGDTYGRVFYRPTRVTSSKGYYISISYEPGNLGDAGWNQVQEAALYKASDSSTPLGRLTYSGNTVTDLGGRTYTITGGSNSLGATIEVISGTMKLPTEASDSTVYTSHASLNLVGAAQKDGVQWTYAYTNPIFSPSTNGYRFDKVTVSGPNGYLKRYDTITASPGNRNVVSKVTDESNDVTEYAYSSYQSRVIKVTMPEGNSVSVDYDAKGNIISKETKPKPGSTLPSLMEQAYVDVANCVGVNCYRPIWFRDALNRQTDFTYNANGQVIEQKDAADANGVRRKKIVEYTSTGVSRPAVVRLCGEGTTCGTSAEARTEYEYWENTSLSLVERKIDQANNVTLETRFAYDAAGRQTMVDGPLPGTDDARYARYDIFGRKTWEIDALGANGLRKARKFTYRDSDDKIIATESGTVDAANSTALTVLSRIDVVYDTRRNPANETVSANGTAVTVVQRAHNDRGQLECEAQRMNPATFANLPASACAAAIAGPHGSDRISKNAYDTSGQLIQVRKAVGTAIEQAYVTYTFTHNGKQEYVIDANGNRAKLEYDGFDRPKKWIFPATVKPASYNPANQAQALSAAGALNLNDYEEYGYDAAGNRTSLRRRDNTTIVYQYDNLNRLTLKTVPTSNTGAAGYAVHSGYDILGPQTYARFGSATGLGVTNTYDSFGRMLNSTNSMGGASRALTYAYDAGARRNRLTWPDGNYLSYNHDPAGSLTGIKENGGLLVASFPYDNAGRPSGMGASGAETIWGYDAISRLQSITIDPIGFGADQQAVYGYNPASQIISRTGSNDAYAFDATTSSNKAYTVNGRNQYVTATGSAFTYDPNGNLKSDGATTFAYDGENRLISATGAKNVSLAYDPMGRLFQVTAGGNSTQFLYDGDELVAEYSGSNALLRRYAHGLGADDPVLWYEGSNLSDRRGMFADHQGSIVTISNAVGAPVMVNGYDVWGNPNASNIGRFQYTGQAWLPELGMYHYKARIYSPILGRFLQTDPVGYKDQMNLYVYVGNDPVNKRDPTGYYTCEKGCEKVEKAVAQLKRIANGSPRTGSRLPDSAQNRMKQLSNAIGKSGEGDVSVNEGSIKENAYATTNGKNITIDFDKLSSSGFSKLSGVVLGHEARHVIQNSTMGQPKTWSDFKNREREALYDTATAAGTLGQKFGGISNIEKGYGDRIEKIARDHCVGIAIDKQQGSLTGSCYE